MSDISFLNGGDDKLFRSEHFHNIDAKGRMIVPARFREALTDQFIITKGLDKCLFVFTMDEWRLLEQKIENLPMADAGARKFLRFFFGAACESERDEQGRVLIPTNLRRYAEITKEIVTVGVARRLEIWSREIYEQYFNDDALDEDVAVKMALLGI
ncbi:MAG: division/cell wall cluster transcriptional repressor MraZ [Defluviitaleaceae bacterium]|nr:division/cell wall cluster transcriptional repressor MraZ [Defluviitaleaceae bacterium]MCL2836654.1 division/cell wall cluster transcriptional repressor MraZ [Defluviitaleaceae bacterium]